MHRNRPRLEEGTLSPLLIIATVAITCALVLYTLGVFGERRAGRLRPRFVVLFWCGLACDTTGTLIMSAIAASSQATGKMGIHAATGALAIVLMLVHAVWATFTCWKGSPQARRAFSRFSVVVWLLWLVPYVCGLLVGIPAISLAPVPAVLVAVLVAAVIAVALWLGSQGRAEAGARCG